MNPFTENPLNHSLAEGIRRVGFRKWYERELLSSHAHMLLALLCTIALIATMELFQGGTRKLPQMVNKLKIETSISLEMRDEEVEIYGKPNRWHIGRG